MEIKQININNKAHVVEVLEHSQDYFNSVYGRNFKTSDIDEFYNDVLKNKCLEDKLLFGIYENESCIGLIDLIRNYHRNKIWFIGLFIIHEACHNKGYGKRAHQWIKEYVKSSGGHVLRLAVVDDNQKALKFWTGQGYHKLKTTQPMDLDQKKQRLHLMELYNL